MFCGFDGGGGGGGDGGDDDMNCTHFQNDRRERQGRLNIQMENNSVAIYRRTEIQTRNISGTVFDVVRQMQTTSVEKRQRHQRAKGQGKPQVPRRLQWRQMCIKVRNLI